MTDLAVLLPIVAFIALAAGLAVVLRGTGRIVARTREVEGFRRASRTSPTAWTPRSMGPPGRSMPSAGTRSPPTRSPTPRRGDRRRRALRGGGTGPWRAAAGPRRSGPRSSTSSNGPAGPGHGRARDGDPGPGPRARRELEAQTSIKRGYLNLLHAREAIARHAVGAANTPTSLTNQPTSGWRRALTSRDHTI